MAEEVKIVEVAGGKGPASEATLEKLLEAVSRRGGGSGSSGGDDSAKIQKAYNDVKSKGIKVSTKNTDAVKNSTSAVKKFGDAAKNAASSIGGMLASALGSITGLALNLGNAFITGANDLTTYASQIPIFGSALGSLTGIFDRTLTVFQDLSSVGGSFNNNLTDLRVSAANAYLSLDQFAGFVRQNSERLAAFGGSVTNGAMVTARLTKNLDQGLRQQLLNMGFSFEEINESMADYMYLTRSAGRAELRANGQTAAAAAEYAQTLQTLAKLTGDDVKAIKDRQAAAQTDLAFQMRLSRMSEDERAKVLQGLAEAEAAGPAAVARFKEEVMGFPPMTRETRLFAATMGRANQAIVDSVALTRRSDVTLQQYTDGTVGRQAAMLAGMVEGAQSLEQVLAAGSLAGEGMGKELLDMLQNSGVDLTRYVGKTGEELERLIAEDLARARAEAARTDPMVQGLTKFQTAMAQVRQTVETELIDRLKSMLGPQIESFSTWFQGIVSSSTFTEGLDSIVTTITGWINDFKARVEGIGLVETIKSYVSDAFSGLGQMIKEFFFGKSDEDAAAETASNNERIEALTTRRTEIEAQISQGEANGEDTSGLQAQLGAINDQINRINESNASLANSGGGLFDSLFGDWDIWEIAGIVGGITVAVVGLGVAANAGAPGLLALGVAGTGLGVLFWGISEALEAASGMIDGFANGVVKVIEAYDAFQEGQAMRQVEIVERLNNIPPGSINATAEAIRNLNSAMAAGDTGFFEGLGNAFTGMIGGDAQTNATNQFERLAGLGTGLQQSVSAIGEFGTLVNTLSEDTKELDTGPIIAYTNAMKELVEVLEDLNRELSRDNNGRFTSGTGENAGTVLSRLGAGGTGGGGIGQRGQELLEQLNTTQEEMLEVLKVSTDYQSRSLRVQRNNGNRIY